MGTVYSAKWMDLVGVKMYVTTSSVTDADQLQTSQLCEDYELDGSGFYTCDRSGQYIYFVQEPDDYGVTRGFTLCGIDFYEFFNLIALEETTVNPSQNKPTVNTNAPDAYRISTHVVSHPIDYLNQ